MELEQDGEKKKKWNKITIFQNSVSHLHVWCMHIRDTKFDFD